MRDDAAFRRSQLAGLETALVRLEALVADLHRERAALILPTRLPTRG